MILNNVQHELACSGDKGNKYAIGYHLLDLSNFSVLVTSQCVFIGPPSPPCAVDHLSSLSLPAPGQAGQPGHVQRAGPIQERRRPGRGGGPRGHGQRHRGRGGPLGP